MIDGSEKRNGWLNFELQSPHVIERRSKGNSANAVCLTSEKGKVARQQQVVRQAGVRGNLQLLCNWSKAARTGNYKRKPLPHNGTLSCLFIEG